MKILLLGQDGQVGWELKRSLQCLGEIVALGRQGQGALIGDLADLSGLQRTLEVVKPDFIVNAAAYTAVDKAEADQALAFRINAEAVGILADYAASSGCWLIHYSTDYVFSGEGRAPWAEQDTVSPLNVYGHSKLEGERAIQRSGCSHLIFRTSWVYGTRGNNFAKVMLRLASERQKLQVVSDQVGAPTGAELIADVTAHALKAAVTGAIDGGIYHLAAGGEVSWHGYACHVIETARALGMQLRVETVEEIPSRAYPTPAQRPLNSRMDTSRVQAALKIRLPVWQEGVDRMLTEIQGL
ncbi:dTDP-4-dehydrorhamnose reductase [Pseudomonas guariconensis]|uniref:dTDP-4-dehydrorhamnose reductase n=1 Tax=Pseudomonas TaxID=286 RepID=UPI00209726BE|nr:MULTISPECIES: dTDP-4-dehydrorhamnose reductase [Pseudomonas]MCO7638972.1 dTDP-4-dehydrorhamnose reductase [Pseudomonas sp. S 311-6]MCO7516729.1 dTDP-4-dehydrorhamnose reductase [Pseudomonas putida]MCO7565665.1 dTDP-4-dehydrorhamnose reductase [Pseudomonas mosselii]MCO7607044.1 dTDP-4-dehydrorhamnose reductase [Pseudomonas guariconensis]MCO7617800.1 dTDP-4-dehydrorhamnose reductase [Pseudomonas guariconensis]